MVVFPAPFGPSSPTTSPPRTSTLTVFTTVLCRKALVNPSQRNRVSGFFPSAVIGHASSVTGPFCCKGFASGFIPFLFSIPPLLFLRWTDCGGHPASLGSFYNTPLLIDVIGHPFPSENVISLTDDHVTIEDHLVLVLIKRRLLTGGSTVRLNHPNIPIRDDVFKLFRFRIIGNDHEIGLDGDVLL